MILFSQCFLTNIVSKSFVTCITKGYIIDHKWKACGICRIKRVASTNENIINIDTPIVERNHLMPFTSLYADSKGSYHNFFSLVGVEFRAFLWHPLLQLLLLLLLQKIQLWNVDIYCTKESIGKKTYDNSNILRYI